MKKMIKQILKSELEKNKGYRNETSNVLHRLIFGLILGILFSIFFSVITIIFSSIISILLIGFTTKIFINIFSGIKISIILGFLVGMIAALLPDRITTPEKDIYFQIDNDNKIDAFEYIKNLQKKSDYPKEIYSIEALYKDIFRIIYDEKKTTEENIIKFTKSIEEKNNPV